MNASEFEPGLAREHSTRGESTSKRAAEAVAAVARASRDTPREAIALMRSVRDSAALRLRSCVDGALVAETLERLGIDERGLRPLDLRTVSREFCSSWAAALD